MCVYWERGDAHLRGGDGRQRRVCISDSCLLCRVCVVCGGGVAGPRLWRALEALSARVRPFDSSDPPPDLSCLSCLLSMAPEVLTSSGCCSQGAAHIPLTHACGTGGSEESARGSLQERRCESMRARL